MLVTGEEAFGPLAALYVFEDAAEAIARASATDFGLAAHVCARDLSRVRRVDEALDYGMQGVTAGLIPTAAAPFGGVRRPGLGREGSWHGIEDYTELKCLCLGLRGASRATRRSTAETAHGVRRRRPWPSLASKEPVVRSGGFGSRAPLARLDASGMVEQVTQTRARGVSMRSPPCPRPSPRLRIGRRSARLPSRTTRRAGRLRTQGPRPTAFILAC